MFDPSEETVNMREGKRKDPLPIGWFALLTPSDAMPKDRALHLKRRLLIMGISVIVLAAVWGMGQSNPFVEKTYADGFGQSVGRGLAFVNGFVPTSLAEVVIVLTVLWFLLIGGRAAWHVGWRKRRALNAVACGVLHLGAFALVALALFYVFWGLNYFRAPLVERTGWQEYARADDAKEENELLYRSCEEAVVATNVNYMAVAGSEDYGSPTQFRGDMLYLDGALDAGYERVQAELQLDESFAARRSRAKPVAASVVMNYLQIGGFYFPWTGEANYNQLQPGCSIPFVIAHEKAHQRCVTSEDEANFFGFLACTHSDDTYARYSGYLFAQRQLLGELFRVDPERAQKLLKQRYPGVQRDVDAIHEYWAQFERGVAGKVGEASHVVNDTYLKSNGVVGGIDSYRLSAKLLIVYARKNGTLIWLPKETD